MLDSWADDAGVSSEEIRAEYLVKFGDPDTVRAICEEHRAAATRDDGGTSCPKMPEETAARLLEFLA